MRSTTVQPRVLAWNRAYAAPSVLTSPAIRPGLRLARGAQCADEAVADVWIEVGHVRDGQPSGKPLHGLELVHRRPTAGASGEVGIDLFALGLVDGGIEVGRRELDDLDTAQVVLRRRTLAHDWASIGSR